MARLKILFLTNRLNPAGAETFLLQRLRCIDRTRFEPFVATLRPGGDLLPAFEELGVRVFCAGMSKAPTAVRGALTLQTHLRRERIDIVEAHVAFSCIVGRIAGSLARTPLIVTNMQDVRYGAQPAPLPFRVLGDVTTPFTDAFVHITKAVERSYREGTPRFLQRSRAIHRIIPNGSDIGTITKRAASVDRLEKRRELGIPDDAFVIGNVARLEPPKGQRYLIEALPEIRRVKPNARIVIVGWGALEAELRQRAGELGVADHVTFLGKRLDAIEILRCFDVFGFPSVQEAQGIALVEAMAVGLPIVAAATDGIPEIVRADETGLLVPAKSPKALSEAILRVASDANLAQRFGEKGKQVAADELSIERSTALYQQLYEELVARNARLAA